MTPEDEDQEPSSEPEPDTLEVSTVEDSDDSEDDYVSPLRALLALVEIIILSLLIKIGSHIKKTIIIIALAVATVYITRHCFPVKTTCEEYNQMPTSEKERVVVKIVSKKGYDPSSSPMMLLVIAGQIEKNCNIEGNRNNPVRDYVPLVRNADK